MALFTWNDSYSVKVAKCDAQHKRLFEIINELGEAMRLGKGQEVMAKTVGKLLEYTRTHFREEEELMRQAKYGQLAAHQELHQKFVGDVEALEQQVNAGGYTNTVQVLSMLRDWLLNHIQKTDTKYSADLNAAGIR